MFTLNARVLTFTLVGGGDVVALQLKKTAAKRPLCDMMFHNTQRYRQLFLWRQVLEINP